MPWNAASYSSTLLLLLYNNTPACKVFVVFCFKFNNLNY